MSDIFGNDFETVRQSCVILTFNIPLNVFTYCFAKFEWSICVYNVVDKLPTVTQSWARSRRAQQHEISVELASILKNNSHPQRRLTDMQHVTCWIYFLNPQTILNKMSRGVFLIFFWKFFRRGPYVNKNECEFLAEIEMKIRQSVKVWAF